MNKRCPKCGEEKALTEFHKNSNRADGLQYKCKPCSRAAQREWAKDNPEKQLAWCRAYRLKNLERINAAQNKRRAASPEKARAAYRKWAAANPEKATFYNVKQASKRTYGEFWEAHRALMDLKKTIKKEAV